ncbi:NBAS protein, partial [Polypterus senegalus]
MLTSEMTIHCIQYCNEDIKVVSLGWDKSKKCFINVNQLGCMLANIRQIALLLLNQYQLLLPALKLLVESENEELQALTLEQITSIKKVDELNCDEELLSRILDANLLVKCVNTAFYASLIKHLLSFHDERGWNVEDIAKQMNEAGYFAEAGSLMLSYRGSHPALSTFNTALSVVKRWL